MPGFSGRRRVLRVSLLLSSCSAILLVTTAIRESQKESRWVATESRDSRASRASRASCASKVGKVLRAPDTLVLETLNLLMELVKQRLPNRRVSAKKIQWLDAAKEEICAKFGISPVPELWICDDRRMLAQAGPHGCSGFGNGWVVLSRGVLETLPPQEVVAVLAHELTHVAKNHHLKRGFLILDFYKLMLLWSWQHRDSDFAPQTLAATVTMWFLLSLRSRNQELEADRHMLDIVRPGAAFYALARMHFPGDDPGEVLEAAERMVETLRLNSLSSWKDSTVRIQAAKVPGQIIRI
eukprot:Skav221727  [mRNA]  locus=scaffold542:372983:373870:- [translate_table: standard]